MMGEIEIGKNAKLKVKWKVNPYDYSPEGVKNMVSAFSKKYEIPADHIKVEPVFELIGDDGSELSMTNDVIANIQNPDFQLKLFKEFMRLNGLVGDGSDELFERVRNIDQELNAGIDYDVYDKFRRFSIKWVKWDNFLSYGKGNVFDFTKLNGLVLLNGHPANQSGKTTFAIDLLHFLLFGKTSKASTLDKIFNRHLKKETTVSVEGCIVIDGEDYVIRRTLTRPQLSKRTPRSKTVQKVEYYKLINGEFEQLSEYADNLGEENSQQTNKVIKEAIGKESDFDLIMSVTEDNLDDIINQKETERGKMLSRWIGLLPIEQKDVMARAKFNSDIKPYLLSNRYTEEGLNNEIEAYKMEIASISDRVDELTKRVKIAEDNISSLEDTKTTLLSSLQKIDESLSNIDVTTLNAKMQNIIDEGKKKREELQSIEAVLNEIGDVAFSIDEYNALNSKYSELVSQKGVLGEKYRSLKETVEKLRKSEYCPTCGRKLEGVDNTAMIEEKSKEMDDVVSEGKKLSKEVEDLKNRLMKMGELHKKFDEKSRMTVKKSAVEVSIERLLASYNTEKNLKREYERNKEAIDLNNEIQVKVNNTSAKLNTYRVQKDSDLKEIANCETTIKTYGKEITDRENAVDSLKEEAKLIKAWKLYLEMVGKNGISKMVLRKTLPIINANLSRLLNDVCDFDVEISITDKNDVEYHLVRDGVAADLSSGSGFERTASALALRAVLAGISTLPRLNFLVFDEILGRVAKENYENMKNLYTRILSEYDFILQISHLDEIKDWHDTTITVCKEDNVSRLQISGKNV